MALITRCPVCGTRFKVVPDQLRISDGWVRCGECGEVFDASAELSQGELPGQAASALNAASVKTPADARTSLAPGAPPTVHTGLLNDPPAAQRRSDWHAAWSSAPPNADRQTAASDIAPAARIDWDAEASFSDTWLQKRDAAYGDGADGADSLSIPVPLEERPGREFPQASAVVPTEPDVLGDAPPEDGHSETPASAEEGEVSQKDEEDEQGPTNEVDEEDDEDEEEVLKSLAAFPADMSTLPEDTLYVVPPAPASVDAALDEPRLSFLKAEPRPAISAWQRPWVRPALVASACLLALTLAGQAAVQQRDQLAAQLPAVRPLLQALCAPLGCTVQPLRRIESIVIDNSTFTTLRHGVYRLNVVLKNRGVTELAVPAIELALTDTQEQPVLRRVLQPVDMAVASGNIDPIAPGAEWTASMELSVADEALISRIVGYRLLAFYP